jgi:hypothetical protein
VPGIGPLIYAGVAGCAAPFEAVRDADDLASPLCAHVREGDWLIDWAVNRLTCEPSTARLGTVLEPVVRGPTPVCEQRCV